MEKARLHAIVKGLVQGVGYRFFVIRRAELLGLTGWVKNLPDGTVEVVAEGDRELLEELVKELRRGPSAAHVTDVIVNWERYTGEFRNFDVRW